MINRKNTIISIFVLLFLVNFTQISSSLAAQVKLKDGKILTGEIVKEDTNGLHIKSEFGTLFFTYKLIAEVSGTPKDYNAIIQELENKEKQKQQEIEQAKESEPDVEIFVTSWCPYCRQLEIFLQLNEVEYKRYDVEKDFEGKRKYNSLHRQGVPVIKIKDTIISGFSQSVLTQALGLGK